MADPKLSASQQEIARLRSEILTLRQELGAAKENAPVHLLGHIVGWTLEDRGRYEVAQKVRGKEVPAAVGQLIVATFDIPRAQMETVSIMLRTAASGAPLPPYLRALEEAVEKVEMETDRATHATAACARYRKVLEQIVEMDLDGEKHARVEMGAILRAVAAAKAALADEKAGAATLDRLRALRRAVDEKSVDVAAAMIRRISEEDGDD